MHSLSSIIYQDYIGPKAQRPLAVYAENPDLGPRLEAFAR